jgi:hypothetical protein
MKIVCCIICSVLLIWATSAFSQKRSSRFFAGGTTLNELNAGLYLTDSIRKGKIDVEVGFVIPIEGDMNIWLNEYMQSPFLQLNKYGPVLRLRYRDDFNKSKPTQFAFSLDGYWLLSRDYIDDQGKHSGSNTDEYKVYQDETITLGFTTSMLFSVDDTDQNYWFLGLGVKHNWIDRTYSVEGTYGDQVLSGRTEELTRFVPWISAGIRFYM